MSVVVERESSEGSSESPHPGNGTTEESPSELVESPEPVGEKHQLQNKWKFWYFENTKGKEWEDCLKVVAEFWTVEDFWSIFNHIKSASELNNGSSYYFFKDGIKPMWEDPINRQGGRWAINFDKRYRHQLETQWMEVLLCLIGEAFDDDGDDICGAAVDVRPKGDRISIWTKDCKNADQIINIGKTIKHRLQLLGSNTMQYESHESTARKTSSTPKPMHVL